MPREKTPSEFVECLKFVSWLETQPVMFSHLPLGSYTPSWSTRIKNRQSGVRAGVPDFLCLCPKQIVFVEMKRKWGGKVSTEQKIWIERLNELGVPARVCKGADEAIAFIKEFL